MSVSKILGNQPDQVLTFMYSDSLLKMDFLVVSTGCPGVLGAGLSMYNQEAMKTTTVPGRTRKLNSVPKSMGET